jgi:hypothetical protein
MGWEISRMKRKTGSRPGKLGPCLRGWIWGKSKARTGSRWITVKRGGMMTIGLHHGDVRRMCGTTTETERVARVVLDLVPGARSRRTVDMPPYIEEEVETDSGRECEVPRHPLAIALLHRIAMVDQGGGDDFLVW